MCRFMYRLILTILPLVLFAAVPAWAEGPSPNSGREYSSARQPKKAPAARAGTKAVRETPPAGPPRELFQKGWYQAAYAAFQPLVATGNPEAAFCTLVIRRNGLDGRAPAGPKELAPLWSILTGNADFMRQALDDGQAPEATAQVYRTILAHLAYFGAGPPVWPPAPVQDGEARSRARAALKEMADAVENFTPAMNFAAFLNYDPTGDDFDSTFELTLKAAEAGDFLAMGNLAWLYREGLGTEKNNLRFAHWARRGCDAHPPVARCANEVGAAYETGRGVTRDAAEAAVWYQRSAAQKYPAGQANASRLKGKGQAAGLPQTDNRLFF